MGWELIPKVKQCSRDVHISVHIKWTHVNCSIKVRNVTAAQWYHSSTSWQSVGPRSPQQCCCSSRSLGWPVQFPNCKTKYAITYKYITQLTNIFPKHSTSHKSAKNKTKKRVYFFARTWRGQTLAATNSPLTTVKFICSISAVILSVTPDTEVYAFTTATLPLKLSARSGSRCGGH